MLWITVEDEGPGIPSDALPMLFEQFFRAQPADSQSVYGHGLGLYLVRRMMEGMQGEVSAANRPEGGARFTCRLPLMEV